MEICKYFWHYFYHSDNIFILKDRKYCINIQNIFNEARKKIWVRHKKSERKALFYESLSSRLIISLFSFLSRCAKLFL